MKSVLIAFSLISSMAFAAPKAAPTKAEIARCKKTPLACKMMEMSAYLDYDTAVRYAKDVAKYSDEMKVDKDVVVAIMMQETTIRNLVVMPDKSIKVFGKENEWNNDSIKVSFTRVPAKPKKVEPTDLGLMQIHYKTAQGLGLDMERLKSDTTYQIRESIKILKDKIELCSSRPTPWACYHSATPSLFAKYAKDVGRWFA